MMTINIILNLTKASGTLILPFYKDKVDYDYIALVSGNNHRPDFSGDADEKLVLYHPEKDLKVFLVGLGQKKPNNPSAKYFRQLAFKNHAKWKGNSLTLDLSHLPEELVFEAVQGITLAGYTMGVFKTSKEAGDNFSTKKLRLDIIHKSKSAKELATEAMQTASTQIEMMKLVNSPANQKTPEYLADYAVQSGKTHGFQVKVLKAAALKKENLYAVLAVGQGSANPPVFIEMEYKPKKSSKRPALGLVGKGITFDTGGLSIKSSQNLHYMKSDMGGAAAVIGAIELAAKLKLNIHIVGIVPSAENSVDAHSFRPGDVINSHSGKTIEIIDTDAEGRLILADGLSYIQKKYKPETIIDLATLTGSCVMTFGYATGALFSNNDNLAKQLMKVGQKTNEKLWQLPLWEEYDDDISSDIADVRNYSGKPLAGAITAAKFLEFFVKDHPNWAHMDIASVAFGDSEFTKMKSATGYGIRLLVEYMKTLIK
jgi:leucyl aminopeptidase